MSGVWKRMLPTLRRQHPLQMLLIILSTIWPSACIQAIAMIKHLEKKNDGRGCGGFGSHAATGDLEISLSLNRSMQSRCRMFVVLVGLRCRVCQHGNFG